jgi:colicin import membrane protein
MWQTLRDHPRILTAVTVAHLLVILALGVGFQLTPLGQSSLLEVSVTDNESFQVIEAVAVDARTFERVEEDKEAAERARLEAERRREEEARRQAEAEAETERQRQAEAERQRQEEARRQAEAEAERQRQAEVRRQAEAEAERKRQEEVRRQAEAEAERKRQAEVRRQAEAEAERKRQEEVRRQAEAERQRRLEEERKAEEARRLAALEAEERRLREAAERQAAEEAARRDAARQRQLQSLLGQYQAAIQSKVQQNWLQPQGFQSGQMAVVFVRQTPGGYIQDVRIERCTGDAAFCRSVEAAVRKAEPLPDPPDPELFAREIRFTFEPS